MACPPIIFFDLSFWWARKKNKTVGNTIFEEALPTLRSCLGVQWEEYQESLVDFHIKVRVSLSLSKQDTIITSLSFFIFNPFQQSIYVHFLKF